MSTPTMTLIRSLRHINQLANTSVRSPRSNKNLAKR